MLDYSGHQGTHLVRLEDHDHVISLDGLPDALGPLHHGALRDRVSHPRHGNHQLTHLSPIPTNESVRNGFETSNGDMPKPGQRNARVYVTGSVENGILPRGNRTVAWNPEYGPGP